LDTIPLVDDRFASLRNATASALVDSSGATSPDLRRAVASGNPPPELMALVTKIRSRAYTVTDQDVDALRSRYTEDQLFEIIVAAAFGAAHERLSAAHRALEEA
jgi:alkylhydroperoxidase family enzyme